MPKNLKICNNYKDLIFEQFENFIYVVSYLGTLFVKDFFLSNALPRFKKNISLIIDFIKKFTKQKLFLIENVSLFVKDFFVVKCFAKVLKNIFPKL